MLLVWWVFLYAFIIFPDEYVVLNVALYSPHYDLLYLVENLAFLGVLGMLAWNTRGAWKQIYLEPVCGFGTLRDKFAGAEHAPSLAANITRAACMTSRLSLRFAG